MFRDLMIWIFDTPQQQHTPLVHHIVNCGYNSIGFAKNSRTKSQIKLRCLKCNEDIPAYLDSNKSDHKQQYITEMYHERSKLH